MTTFVRGAVCWSTGSGFASTQGVGRLVLGGGALLVSVGLCICNFPF
jgi:hypothetical protein